VIDSPEAKTALDYYYGLYHDGLATTPDDIGAQWPGDLGEGLSRSSSRATGSFPFLATKRARAFKIGNCAADIVRRRGEAVMVKP